MKPVIAILCFGLIAGCSSTYQNKETVPAPSRLDYTKGVLVSVPANGKNGDQFYPRSGEQTAEAIADEFRKYASMVNVTEACRGMKCLSTIDTAKYGYYVEPGIVRWIDRSEWTGMQDKVEIHITVYDSISRRKLSETSFEGKSKWISFGGDPTDLLPDPTAEYVDSLY